MSGIEGHVDHRIVPVELPLELVRARGFADHDRAGGNPFIEACGNIVAAGGEFGIVDMAAVGDEVAAVLRMVASIRRCSLRIVDAKGALLQVGAGSRHRS